MEQTLKCGCCGSTSLAVGCCSWVNVDDGKATFFEQDDAEHAILTPSRYVCRECGYTLQPMDPICALDSIHVLLDAREWTSDTIEKIAEILRIAGYTINEPLGDDDA